MNAKRTVRWATYVRLKKAHATELRQQAALHAATLTAELGKEYQRYGELETLHWRAVGQCASVSEGKRCQCFGDHLALGQPHQASEGKMIEDGGYEMTHSSWGHNETTRPDWVSYPLRTP